MEGAATLVRIAGRLHADLGDRFRNRLGILQPGFVLYFQNHGARERLVKGILFLYGPGNLGAALQDAAQKRVQVAVEDLVKFNESEIAEHLAQDAIDFTESAAGNRSLNGR